MMIDKRGIRMLKEMARIERRPWLEMVGETIRAWRGVPRAVEGESSEWAELRSALMELLDIEAERRTRNEG